MSTDHQNGNSTSDATRMQEALRVSELSYRRLFEAAQDGILILDVDTGRINDVNPFLSVLLGFSRDEMIGKTVGELSPFKDIESNKVMWERLKEQGYVRYHDLPLTTKDGRNIAVEFVSNVYQVGDKKMIQCNIRDITERKKSEEQLRLLNTCVSNLNDIVVITDADLIDEPGPRIVFVNEAFERITGYTSAEAIGRSPRFLQGDNTNTRILAEIRQALLNGQPIRRQVINYRKDGTQYWMDIDIVPVSNSSGKCTHFAAIERDITESKNLKESLELFRTLMERSPDAIEIIDPKTGRFLDVNETACRRLGYTRDEMLSLSFRDIVDSDDTSFSMKEVIGELKKTGFRTVESRHQRKDGSHFPVEINVQYINLNEGYMVAVVRDITERRVAEEALRSSERTMAAAQCIAHIGSWEIGLSIEMTVHDKPAQCSDEMFRIAGYQPGEIEPSNEMFLKQVPPEEHEAMRCAVADAIATRQQYSIVHRLIRPDGEVRVVQEVAHVIYNEKTGQPLKLVGTTQDITERRATETALRKERDFISAVVDTVGSLVVVLDRQAHIVRFNRACEQLTGYSFDEALGRNLIDLVIMPEERTRTQIEFGNLCAGQFPNTFENHWLTKEGKPRMIAWSNTALVDADGAVEFVIGTGTDVTEQKRATEQITQQAALLDKAQDAIIVRDLTGIISSWNKGAERIYGWTHQEAVGQNVTELYYPERKKFDEVNGLTISQGEWHGELPHRTKDHREITIEGRWTLLRDDEGHPKSILAINTDITEKKLIEAQFMRAQRMESIGTLAGGIAHDLNNILAPILMSIDILKLTANNPQAKSILETIEVSAKRGADIVRQVLSFARGLEGERVEVQPKHLLQDVESIIKDTFPKDIRLRFSIPNDIWTILGDPTQVHQILLNLCVNARDAMPNGGSLTIDVENCVLDEHYAAMNLQAKAGRYVNINVADSGTGIPPKLLEKIFEPFFTTKAINKGTGLGLSTVMAIVKSHGGMINVYSEPGKGTTFKVYLPAMEMSSEARKTQLEQASLPRGNGETVLLVDDEASIINITTQTLQAFGYRVLTAADGAEAVAAYAEHKNEIAVVLTDMAMPIMDGAAAIRALSKINPAIKIIAASGLHANADATKASGAGIKHFLTKPYTAGTLLKTLRTILEEA